MVLSAASMLLFACSSSVWLVDGLELTSRIIAQGRALVRAIEALGTIEPTGPFERALARLLIAAYKRRLRAI